MTAGPYPGKRAFDLSFALAAALPAVAIGLCCAIAIKLTSRGPIFFKQERVGMHGRPFEMVKFRTMVNRDDNPVIPDPSRITAVGKWLRRLSLDELPQLINVIRGDMSIVGPRPALPYQVERYSERQAQRLTVRPGVTGLAQIRGRNQLSWTDRIELDLEYLTLQSWSVDAKIVARTASIVVGGSGVEGHPLDDPLV